MERAIAKLYAHKVDADMTETLCTFWKEWNMSCGEKDLYSKRNMWNVKDAREGNLRHVGERGCRHNGDPVSA